MVRPPCTLPPQLMSVGEARNRKVALGAVPAAVYCSSAIAASMRLRIGILDLAWRCRCSSRIVVGSHCGTSTAARSSSIATKIVRHCAVWTGLPLVGSVE